MPAWNEPPTSPNGHSHEPNLITPHGDGSFSIAVRAMHIPVSVALLATLPQTTIQNAYIRSTGHPSSGPFRFDGVRLLDLLSWCNALGFALDGFREVRVQGADGFGTRMSLFALRNERAVHATLLATHCDARKLTRKQGLVRLIVPSEKDEALRQIKWIGSVALL